MERSAWVRSRVELRSLNFSLEEAELTRSRLRDCFMPDRTAETASVAMPNKARPVMARIISPADSTFYSAFRADWSNARSTHG
jgi:hypothetical protein